MAHERKSRIEPVEEVHVLRSAAFDHRLSRGDVGVLAAVLQHCDATGFAFPGPSLIANLANLATTNAKRSLRKLEELGYLRVVRRGERRRSEYLVQAPPPIPTRRASVPSSNLKKGHDSARERAQFATRADACARVTGYESITATGDAGVRNLGTLARHESTSEFTYESTGAERAIREQEKQEQEESRREGLRSEYLGALLTHPEWARRMERNSVIRPLIEDLIQDQAA